jgi:HlyD family secretion protein
VAEARVASLRARVKELRAGSRPQEIATARAAVASAQATLEKAGADLKRLEPLAAQGVISRQELDTARQAYEVARANLDSARKNAEMWEIGPRQEEIEAAEAQRREAEANLEYARTQLDFTVIRAPISGTILEKLAKKGELVTNTNFGGTRGAKSSVVSMADLKDLQVEVDLNENDLPKVRLNQNCEIRLDSHPDAAFEGRVDEIAPQADRQKATVQVKVRLVNPQDFVRPEVNARVTFLEDAPAPAATETVAPRVWIPRTALVSGAEGPMVFIAADRTAVGRRVTRGMEGPRGVQITDGLAGNEMLIVEPLEKIKDGARISVVR